MVARRELLERTENDSKAYGSDFRFHYLPTWQEFETAVRSLCSQYVLISFSVCHYRASTIRFALPLYASCAYSRSSYVNTALPLRLWRSWLCPRCCSDAFNCFIMDSCHDSTSAWPFQPVTLFLAERRPAALVLSLYTLRSTGDLRLE